VNESRGSRRCCRLQPAKESARSSRAIGSLHRESLLRAVQEQCGFEAGELRCVFVEAQPLGQSTMSYRIVDAMTGLREKGEIDVRALRDRQPWATQ
jgi:hypothetical protein